jgi:AsmA-like C-terminal region
VLATLRHRRLILGTLTITLILGALALSRLSRITPHVRDAAVAGLEERFRSDVDIESLQVSVFPRPEVLGTGLTVRLKANPKITPMIRVDSYAASGGVWGLTSTPVRLKSVDLEGLAVTLQPGVRRAPGAERDNVRPKPVEASASPSKSRLVIDEIVARKATLEILSRDEGKLPRVFEIHDLVMHGLGDGGGSSFSASLTNWKPSGEITTHGRFGPWSGDEPRQTPIRGDYVFRAANLNTIKGIAGTLSSKGSYSGVLERIDVTGETDTPDFSIDVVGRPVPLKTRFDAVVDATNGDTWLERVEARLGETLIVARGAVVRAQDVKGRKTSLDLRIDDGRIEDVLKLGVKAANPIMTGRMRLKTTFLLPAGERDVLDKLELAGTFSLDEARFTNMNVQQRINTLSQRGKGDIDDNSPSVVSRLSGTFTLRDGMLTFANLTFGVPGAVVQIAGTYNIRRELLDFKGHLLLDASLAETTTGFKAVLATIAQPLFRRPGGGSKIPIKIFGPREKPEFGLDVRRALGPG